MLAKVHSFPRSPRIPDIVALLVLASLMVVLSELIRGTGYVIWLWVLGYPALAVWGWFACRSEWLDDPSECLFFAFASVVVGGVSFAIDAMVTTSLYPNMALKEAIWHAGS